jgi:hypothetical protein
VLLKKVAVLGVAVLALQVWSVQADPLVSALSPAIPMSGEAAKYLKGIEIRNADGDLPDSETTVVSVSPSLVLVNLGLGDAMAKAIMLYPAVPGTRFKVEQRYETSLTVMDEGPHLDLLDWKHHVSEWEEVPSRDGVTFVSKEIVADEFPSVTRAEIVQAVAAELKKWGQNFDGERWIGLAETCSGPRAGACNVSVSKIMLRVRVMETGGWKDVQTIEIAVPMGC